MTRPWTPAEIAGAKAVRRASDFPDEEWEDLDPLIKQILHEQARSVLDAAGAAQRAEVDAEQKRTLHAMNLQCHAGRDGDPCENCLNGPDRFTEAFAAQVRGAGAGEQP